ncbi:MAG: VOC family protein [Bryobacteraceae bacterium]
MFTLLLIGSAALWAQPKAHFHHVHLNSTDPVAATAFYAQKFACEKASYAGKPAIWAQKSWLLFDKVKTAPPPGALESDSPVWHIGWGAEDMPAAVKKQIESGTKFQTPITDISDLANFKGFYYAYVDGPDRALIELNTARHHNFGHLHLFSNDPHAAADWYAKYLGITARKSKPETRMYRDVQVGPSASFNIDNVNVIIYPAGYRKHNRFRSSRGTVFDHVAFSVDQLAPTLEALRRDGVKILRKPGKHDGHRSVLVEGPDMLAVEIVEGHASRQ